jgi:hypothetical protein
MPLEIRPPATRDELGTWPDLSDPDTRAELTTAATKALPRLQHRWNLSVGEMCGLLGDVPASTWHSWKSKPPVDLGEDRLTRVSLLLGIYTALHVLHDEPLADQWVHLPNSNPIFGGRAPLDVMRHGGIPAMLAVRTLLDGRRGGL